MNTTAINRRIIFQKFKSNQTAYLLLFISVLLVLYWGLQWWRFTIDDSYIVYRYAQNIAHGVGAVFNSGEYVEGYSCGAWVFLLALVGYMGLDVVFVSKFLGLLCAVFLSFMLFIILYFHIQKKILAGIASLWFISLPGIHLYAVSGMETLPFCFAISLSIYLISLQIETHLHAMMIVFALFLVSTLRPEGLLLSLSLFCVAFYTAQNVQSRRILAIFFILLGLLFAIRWFYYTDLLPNTYYAKPSEFLFRLRKMTMWETVKAIVYRFFIDDRGPEILWQKIGGTALIVPFLIAIFRSHHAPLQKTCLTTLIVGIIYLIYCPWDWMPEHRFALPFYFPFMILIILGIDHLLQSCDSDRKLNGILISGLLIWVISNFSETNLWLKAYQQGKVNTALDAQRYAPIGMWLKTNASPKDVVLCYEIGAVGYFSQRRILDHEGLINREIAKIVKEAGGYGRVRTGQNQQALEKIVVHCVQSEPEWFLVRAKTPQKFPIDKPLPEGICREEIQNVLLSQFGTNMVLKKSFSMNQSEEDQYLLLHHTKNKNKRI